MKDSTLDHRPDGEEPELKRSLSNRHIQLIAIGGAIGTGLFMGSGKTISLAGPSIIFVYMIIGFMLFFVMRAMGELLLSNLNYKSFIDFSADLLGPRAGYFTGWTYWFCWIVTGIADVIAISGYTQFWFPDIPLWLPAIACVALLLSLNLITVKMFGELEFWFAMIKIVAICALVCTGLYMVVTAFQSPNGNTASVANLWNDGGMFPHGLMGFFAGFQIAVFAFVGIELVGTTAAETKNPERNLPRAINSIPLRIIMFYVFALIAILAVTPWRDVVANKSPFVELFMLAGLPAAAGIINFVVLTSAASSANSGVFSTSRMLFGLALEGEAPRKFKILSPARSALQRPDLFLHLSVGGCAGDLSGAEPDGCIHPDHHCLGDPVHVCVDDDPAVLPGVSQKKRSPAPGIALQNAGWQGHGLGLPDLLCLHPGIACPGGRYPSGAVPGAGLVRGAGPGLSFSTPQQDVGPRPLTCSR